MDTKLPNISVSLLKAFDQFSSGDLCGELFKKVYVTKEVVSPPSDAMRKGQYLEYLCTGQGLRDGTIPTPDTTQKGELTAPYKVIAKQAERFKIHCKFHKVETETTGEVMEWEFEDGVKGKGISDIRGTVHGKRAIIDIKSTAFIDNKWEEYGWENESLRHKPNLLMQAPMYKLLWKKLHDQEIEFYYMVYSTANDWMAKMIRVDVADETLERMEGRITFTAEMIDYHMKTNTFTPLPSIENCHDCPCFDVCEFHTVSPKIFIIQL